MAGSAWVWVPPANWPAAPEGFVPQPGWVPDPRWGPAPEGWQFWQQRRVVSSVAQRLEAEGLAPEVAEAVSTLTPLERRCFRGIIEQAMATPPSGPRSRSARAGGFTSATHLLVASLLTVVGAALAWSGVAVETLLAGHHRRNPLLVTAEVLLLVAGAACFGLCFLRITTARRAKRLFIASGRNQEALSVGPPPTHRTVPPVILGSVALLSIDMALIGISLERARFTAPRVTAIVPFACAGGLFWLLSVLWKTGRTPPPPTS